MLILCFKVLWAAGGEAVVDVDELLRLDPALFDHVREIRDFDFKKNNDC